MFDPSTLMRGEDHLFHYRDGDQLVELEEMFPQEDWDSPKAFKMAGIHGYEPMTAKELETEEAQDDKLNDPGYFLEEKFDGTRALVYFLSQQDYHTHQNFGFCRVFSRRISKKTGFYVENTDSLPHIRELDVPELAGTVLDGEMFINGLPFKEVSSTLNCLWDKAVDRQIEKGFITFHAFDILFYKGVDLRKMPLYRRKVYLHHAIHEAGCKYIEEVPCYNCGENLPYSAEEYFRELNRTLDEEKFFKNLKKNNRGTYPNLYECWSHNTHLTPRAFYELIVATGGEGLIVKPKNGKYHHKRGWEYSKIKKFLTREMIVLGFDEPTREYSGKDIRRWAFWVEKATNRRVTGNFYGNPDYIPVTKFYYYNQVGNLLLGILIPKDEWDAMPANKRGVAYTPSDFNLDPRLDETYYLMHVCECAGFDDETRGYFTENRDKMVGSVIEVKANELFRDTGKMRHPRYMRVRYDKEPDSCVWADHIGSSEVTK